jgi:hypothetical protein
VGRAWEQDCRAQQDSAVAGARSIRALMAIEN